MAEEIAALLRAPAKLVGAPAAASKMADRPDTPPALHAADDMQALRAELVGMDRGALEKCARANGVTTEQLDYADEQAVYELILEAASGVDAGAALRAELAEMKMGALKKRAREAGVTPEQLDDADDADDPKEAVMELIVRSLLASAAMRCRPPP